MLLTAIALALMPSVTEPEMNRPLVDRVVIQGNARTRDRVIRNELQTEPGMPFDDQLWAEDVQRIRDLDLFWQTEATAATVPDGVELYLTVAEKWTLIPSFGFTRTPDTLEWYTGLYEANFLGLNMELGFQFHRRRGGNTYTLWHYNERVDDTPVYYELEGHLLSSQHVLYDQEADPLQYYQASGRLVHTEVGMRLDDRGYHRLGFIYRPSDIDYALWEDTAEQQRLHESTGARPPEPQFLQQVGLRLRLNELRQTDYIFSGQMLSALYLTTPRFLESSLYFTQVSAEYRYLFTPLPRHNAGFRVFTGLSYGADVVNVFRMGGLHEVRGFPDERFRGENIWFANTEYRYPAIDSTYLLAQVVGFVDGGRTWNGRYLSTDAFREMALSGGIGVRFLVKPLVATRLRIDYGRAVSPYRTGALSIGVQQFF